MIRFRDNYQTATYLATQIAFNSDVSTSFETHDDLKPKIFEIGRTHAIDLTGETFDEFNPTRILPSKESLRWNFLAFLGISLGSCFYLVYFRNDRGNLCLMKHFKLSEELNEESFFDRNFVQQFLRS